MGLPRMRAAQPEVLGALPGLWAESEATVIRAIINAGLDGYRWPEEWNRYQHTLGHHFAIIEIPPRRERFVRAIIWGTNTAREHLAIAIHPDL